MNNLSGEIYKLANDPHGFPQYIKIIKIQP